MANQCMLQKMFAKFTLVINIVLCFYAFSKLRLKLSSNHLKLVWKKIGCKVFDKKILVMVTKLNFQLFLLFIGLFCSAWSVEQVLDTSSYKPDNSSVEKYKEASNQLNLQEANGHYATSSHHAKVFNCNNCTKKIISLIKRKVPKTIKSTIIKEINKHQARNGKCKSDNGKSTVSSYIDSTSDTCKICGDSCSKNDYLCWEECESLFMKRETAFMIQQMQQQYKKEINSLKTKTDVYIVIFAFAFLIFGVLFVLYKRKCDGRLKKIEGKLNNAGIQVEGE